MKTYKLNDLNNPLISVLMPAYNAEKYIKEAIESILNQTFSNFEFIIIDDGSIDATEEIIKSFKDSRIVYIKNEKNLGLIKTLNKGISIARGEFIARMDSDDISMPQRFELQLDVFKKYKGVDIVNVALKKMSEDGTKLSKYRHNIYPGFEISLRQVFSPNNLKQYMEKRKKKQIVKYTLNILEYGVWSKKSLHANE